MGNQYIHEEQFDHFLRSKPQELLGFIKAAEIFSAETTEKIGTSFPVPGVRAGVGAKVDLDDGELIDAVEEQGLFIRLSEDQKLQLSDGESDSDEE